MEVITREEARALGQRRYFTGVPCLHGHVDERYVKGGACEGCNKVRTVKATMNPASYAKYLASSARANIRRNYRQEQATPPWANRSAIADVYAEAAIKSASTGKSHHVHHVVPLHGVDDEGVHAVCGLHVHNNLRPLPGVENLSIGNRWWPGRDGFMLTERYARKLREASKDRQTAGLSDLASSEVPPTLPPSAARRSGANRRNCTMNAIETLSATLTGMFTPDAEPVRDNNALDRAAVRSKRYPSQEAHEARRAASIKDSAGGKVVAQVKEASKRTPKGKSANKPGNPVPVAGRAREQNGVKAPKRDGSIAQCWALFDQFPETTAANLLDYCEALDLNLSNMTQELYRWRRFNGMTRATK